MGAREPSCEEVIRRLFAYLDGELNSATEEEIAHHLTRCRDCFSRAEFERRLRARVAEAGTVEAPERLHHRLRQLLDEF
ncbi:anti-sigma factor family protein [Spiribacter halobius]|uniref:Anti-sigma factor n=1 Tax=Sediminicurvatus halobius TaxID=2182432 RepID=A0A2U2N4D7_9GAMM|nr:zf-HC2 domain-containing protein [Spiribacter halobius]PWG63953.1 anti-sigma factor [Spiribacter halobius]UEX76368.1 zf-HC2 domain-containing protein [Spiribacter halobius]